MRGTNTGDGEAKFIKASARMQAQEAHVLLGMYDQINPHVPEVKVVTRAPVLYVHNGQLLEAAEGYSAHCKVFVTQGFKGRHRIAPRQARHALLDVLENSTSPRRGIAPELMFASSRER